MQKLLLKLRQNVKAAIKAEQERIAAEQAEAQRQATLKAEQDRIAAEQAKAEREAALKAEQDRIAAQQAKWLKDKLQLKKNKNV